MLPEAASTGIPAQLLKWVGRSERRPKESNGSPELISSLLPEDTRAD